MAAMSPASNPTDIPTSVPLPARSNPDSATRPPIWPIVQSSGTAPVSIPLKCSRHERVDGVCCKELKGDDERTLIDPDVVRDVYVITEPL
jgi:hypothetical protein